MFSSGITGASRPYAIAPGPDGNLWFTEEAGRIGRITPDGTVTEYSTGVAPGDSPQGIVAGPDSNIWFTKYGTNTISRLTLDPAAVTGAAGSVSATGAVVAGTVSAFGAATSYAVQYGRSTAYGAGTDSLLLPAGTRGVAVFVRLSGLAPQTAYHYRLVATSSAGTTFGGDRTFTTAAGTGGAGGGGGGGGGGSGGGGGDRNGPRLVVGGKTLRLLAKGRVRLALRCPLTETLGCRGSVRLETAAKLASHRRKRLKLASAKFKIGGGQARTVSMTVSRRGRSLARRHKLKVRAVVVGIDASGNRGTTVKAMTLAK